MAIGSLIRKNIRLMAFVFIAQSAMAQDNTFNGLEFDGSVSPYDQSWWYTLKISADTLSLTQLVPSSGQPINLYLKSDNACSESDSVKAFASLQPQPDTAQQLLKQCQQNAQKNTRCSNLSNTTAQIAANYYAFRIDKLPYDADAPGKTGNCVLVDWNNQRLWVAEDNLSDVAETGAASYYYNAVLQNVSQSPQKNSASQWLLQRKNISDNNWANFITEHSKPASPIPDEDWVIPGPQAQTDMDKVMSVMGKASTVLSIIGTESPRAKQAASYLGEADTVLGYVFGHSTESLADQLNPILKQISAAVNDLQTEITLGLKQETNYLLMTEQKALTESEIKGNLKHTNEAIETITKDIAASVNTSTLMADICGDSSCDDFGEVGRANNIKAESFYFMDYSTTNMNLFDLPLALPPEDGRYAKIYPWMKTVSTYLMLARSAAVGKANLTDQFLYVTPGAAAENQTCGEGYAAYYLNPDQCTSAATPSCMKIPETSNSCLVSVGSVAEPSWNQPVGCIPVSCASVADSANGTYNDVTIYINSNSVTLTPQKASNNQLRYLTADDYSELTDRRLFSLAFFESDVSAGLVKGELFHTVFQAIGNRRNAADHNYVDGNSGWLNYANNLIHRARVNLARRFSTISACELQSYSTASTGDQPAECLSGECVSCTNGGDPITFGVEGIAFQDANLQPDTKGYLRGPFFSLAGIPPATDVTSYTNGNGWQGSCWTGESIIGYTSAGVPYGNDAGTCWPKRFMWPIGAASGCNVSIENNGRISTFPVQQSQIQNAVYSTGYMPTTWGPGPGASPSQMASKLTANICMVSPLMPMIERCPGMGTVCSGELNEWMIKMVGARYRGYYNYDAIVGPQTCDLSTTDMTCKPGTLKYGLFDGQPGNSPSLQTGTVENARRALSCSLLAYCNIAPLQFSLDANHVCYDVANNWDSVYQFDQQACADLSPQP